LEANRRKFYTIYFSDEALNTKSRWHHFLSFLIVYLLWYTKLKCFLYIQTSV
jgi:hypothetical protein